MSNTLPPLHSTSPPPLHSTSPPPLSPDSPESFDELEDLDSGVQINKLHRIVDPVASGLLEREIELPVSVSLESAVTPNNDDAGAESFDVLSFDELEGHFLKTPIDPDPHTNNFTISLDHTSAAVLKGNVEKIVPSLRESMPELTKNEDNYVNSQLSFAISNDVTSKNHGSMKNLTIEIACEKKAINSSSDDEYSPVIDESAFIVDDEKTDSNFVDLNSEFQSFIGAKVDLLTHDTDNLFTGSKFSTDNNLTENIPITPVLETNASKDFRDETISVITNSIIDSEKFSNRSTVKPNDFIEDDNEFTDFISPESFVSNTVPSTSQIQSVTIPESVPYMKSILEDECNKDVSKDWTNIFSCNGDNPVEVNLNSIEGKLSGSSVWCKIKDMESSPALHCNWIDSESNKMLLTTLSVDSRNILFGPRWSSEVPQFASNLGFNPLIPQKVSNGNTDFPVSLPVIESESTKSEPEDRNSLVADPARDAHFDWNNDGLTNMLDSDSHSTLLDLDLLANFDIHSPYYKEKRKSKKFQELDVSQLETVHKESRSRLSAEAEKVLNSLPNLIVMEKQYIVFPTR